VSRTFDELISTAVLDLSRAVTPPEGLAEAALAGADRRHRMVLIACVATALVSLGTGSLAAISNRGAPQPRTPARVVTTSASGPSDHTSQTACPSPQAVTSSGQPCLDDPTSRTFPAPSRTPQALTAPAEPPAPEPTPTKRARPHPKPPRPSDRGRGTGDYDSQTGSVDSITSPSP
jgi:hypothetical protein